MKIPYMSRSLSQWLSNEGSLMLNDIVVDTNVMVHAQTPGEARYVDSLTFLGTLLKTATVLCVDNGFSVDPAQNRSLIAAEYIDKLRFGSFAMNALIKMAGQRRVKEVPRLSNRATVRWIVQHVRKPRDRTFLNVAHNSDEGVLVSHDFQDFQQAKRKSIRKKIGVRVLVAEECSPEL